MIRFIFPSKDASLYEEIPNGNTGLDEVLEVGKTSDGLYAIRSLLHFDIPSDLPISASYDLILRVARVETINQGQEIEIIPVTSSWDEGTGYLHQTIVRSADGVFWSSSIDLGSGSMAVTASADDITVDVTSYVHSWLSGTLPNHGLMLKFPDFDEQDTDNIGWLSFFSKQTHTVYQPTIIAKWDDQVYVTGSVSWSTANTPMAVTPIINSEYKADEVVSVPVMVREKYPQKTFDTVFSRFSGNVTLPSSSYYSVVDAYTNVPIIPFSDATKISSDEGNNYFMLPVSNMYAQRYYKVLIKVVVDDSEMIFDNKTWFKVTS